MILRDVMESWLPKSILILNGFLFFVQIEALNTCANWNKGLVIMKQKGGSWQRPLAYGTL